MSLIDAVLKTTGSSHSSVVEYMFITVNNVSSLKANKVSEAGTVIAFLSQVAVEKKSLI